MVGTSRRRSEGTTDRISVTSASSVLRRARAYSVETLLRRVGVGAGGDQPTGDQFGGRRRPTSGPNHRCGSLVLVGVRPRRDVRQHGRAIAGDGVKCVVQQLFETAAVGDDKGGVIEPLAIADRGFE